ncbi:TonB-dependent receptor [Acidobacterium sp. S8]|uniref:TonB-dependent receptor n=1 Tax=Acidobacterium sp. S8 TaxID=1641854 RepID=UPI00131AE096|nr:TonB-dependent receptor [Acidobacterium sp. S8]
MKRQVTSFGLLMVASLLYGFILLPVCRAQQLQPFSGIVLNDDGSPIAHAEIDGTDGSVLAVSGDDGRFHFSNSSQAAITVRANAPGYGTITVTLLPLADAHITLLQHHEEVVVTAYRSPLDTLDSPVSTRVMGTRQLQEAATPALDGRLRQVPGVELFRRSSSLVANPTSQGISLRGLGSTAASRTLVVSDDVPLNDPYGGWIHWEEMPALAVQSVEVVRGGASDLYGSSAIGGVIDVMPVKPERDVFALTTGYGGESTTENGVLASLKRGPWGGLFAGGIVGTDGYILTAPDLRGPIDQANNVHSQNGLIDLERTIRNSNRIFLRGSGFNEARDNGTPLQKNATRLWRYSAGTDWSQLTFRFYGSTEHYRQTFSSINSTRTAETLTRYAEDPADELGAAAHWRQPIGAKTVVLAGADTHDVRASDDEVLFAGAGGIQNTAARQRQTGIYGEALSTPGKWTLSASGRVDHFSNFDAAQWTQNTVKTYPSFSETVFDPRLGLSRRITSNFALHASGFRAYRAPTQNELYRTGQVGQQVTLPNANLRSERATGWETGFQANLPQWQSMLRVSYFWTRVNRPITALTLSSTPTSTLLQRENLGQIESRGVSVDYESHPVRWATLTGGYQFANATVTSYTQQPQLVGNWIPQVARNMATTQVRVSDRRIGVLSLQARISGRQFDDDANNYLLHSYFRLDAYGSREFGRHVELFAAGENLFDRSIEVGKTPLTTLGTPRLARFGLRLRFGE